MDEANRRTSAATPRIVRTKTRERDWDMPPDRTPATLAAVDPLDIDVRHVRHDRLAACINSSKISPGSTFCGPHHYAPSCAASPVVDLCFEVSLRERPARAGLQIALEAEGSRLISELNDDVNLPRSARSRVRAATSVVVLQPCIDVGREADIELGFLIRVCQNVDKAFGVGHEPAEKQAGCPGKGTRRAAASHVRGVPRRRFCTQYGEGRALFLRRCHGCADSFGTRAPAGPSSSAG
jgi:hypothetical protein